MGAATLLRLARRLHGAASLAEVMDQVVDAVSEATRYRRAWLILPMEQGYGIDVIGYVVADRQRVNQRMASLDWRKDRLLALELSTDRTLVFPDLRLVPEADQVQVEYFGNRTVIVVPMLRLGERLGSFNLGTFAAEGVMPPTQEELDFAEEVAALISMVAGRLRAEEAHRALAASVEREQRLEALGRMAGEVAHDFNNMLLAIIGNAELALASDSPQAVRELLAEVLDAGARAAGVSRQLLAFSRGQPVERGEVDLAETVEHLGPMLRTLLPSSIALEVTVRERPRSVLANAGQLEQVVVNLVLNARDAIAGNGSISLTVDTIDRDGRRWARLAVEDSGQGMSPEVSTRIFEPFFTTKAPGKGTGLGLAVVAGVVKSHGGVVDVASRPGQGTRFSVELPESTQPVVRLKPSARPAPALVGTELVLVADDDVSVRVLLERVLTSAGYRVILAEDGEVALEQLARNPDVRLIITDLVMPRLRGDELLRRVAGRVKVLLISGYAPHPVILDAGAHVLAKPFASKELLQRVREVIDTPDLKGATGTDGPR
jgi:signal transduction histidine kinase